MAANELTKGRFFPVTGTIDELAVSRFRHRRRACPLRGPRRPHMRRWRRIAGVAGAPAASKEGFGLRFRSCGAG
jgi:hypothetical protein